MKRILFTFLAPFLAICCQADDSIWVYKKAFLETYHIDRNCPVIAGKKVVAYSLSDESDIRTKMRTAIQLADNCPICHTPNIRGTRDSRLEQVLSDFLGTSVSYDDEDSTQVNIPFTDASLFDDEVVLGLPDDLPEGYKVSSSVFKTRGHRFKMLEVKQAVDDRLIGSTVTCEVINSRKSNIMGTEGYLSFRPLYLTTDDGTVIRMKPTEFMVRGKNRQCIKAFLCFCPPMWFIPGQGARIRATDQFVATLDPTADISADGIIRRKLQKEAEAKALRAKLESTLNGEKKEGEEAESEEEKAQKEAESAKAREDVRKLLGL